MLSYKFEDSLDYIVSPYLKKWMNEWMNEMNVW